MNNEILQGYVGKYCTLSTGAYGSSIKGKILRVVENWIEVDTRWGKQLVNAYFVTLIRVNEKYSV